MDSFQNMIREQQQCFQRPDAYSFECAQQVTENYIRNTDMLKDAIYPWRNYDWDYSNVVDKLYKPSALGASGKGTVNALVNDIDLLVKSIEGLIITPNPDKDSAAAMPGKTNDLVPCSNDVDTIKNLSDVRKDIKIIQNKLQTDPENQDLKNRLNKLINKTQVVLKSCAVLNSLKLDGLQQEQPYKDPFFNRKLDGENSSSYFAKVGVCPVSIDNKKKCESKGYKWMGNPLFKQSVKGINTTAGSCFKDKYIYIDNKPGISIGEMKSFKGMIPSVINDFSQLSPDKLLFALNGFGIPGLDIQSCEEPFTNNMHTQRKDDDDTYFNRCLILFFFLISIILILFF